MATNGVLYCEADSTTSVSEEPQMMARICEIETQLKILSAGQAQILEQLQVLVSEKKNTQKLPIKKKAAVSKNRRPTIHDMSMLQSLPEALQEHIINFTNDLVFKDALRDRVIEKDCLSEEDCELIDSKPTTRDQTRLLIKKLKDRGPIVIRNFLDILQEDIAYKHLAEMVNESFLHISKQYRDTQCVVCVLRTHVDVKDVGDFLWKNRVIPDRVWDSIVDLDSTFCNRTMLWNEIFSCINACKNVDEVKDILIESIEKYPDVVEIIKRIPSRQHMSCCCLRRRSLRQKRSYLYGSTSDISTTSEIPRGNLPSGNLFTDYDSAPSSMDPLKDSFTSQHSFSKEHLDHYDSIGSSKDNDDVQNTTASPRNRHQSEKFVPQENFVNEESDRCQSLSGYYGEGLPENAPENTLNQMFDRSMSKMSNSTLQAPKSGSGNESSIGEHTECKVSLTSDVRSSTSDKATSPEVDIPSHNFNVRQEENPNNTLDNQDHETDNHSHSNYRKRTDNSNSKTSQSPKERMKGKCNSENDDEVFVDVDADSDAHPDMTRKERRKIKNKRQKIKTRQNTPFSGGLFVTRSVSYQEKVDPKIGVKPLCVKKSKKSAKRELRRQRSRQECATSDELCDNSDESRGLKHPYNPMVGKVPRPKLTPSWDYHQTRRFFQLCQLNAMTSNQNAFSDTDNMTLSDSELTEYTV
ncbi:uncharacterized protein LOC128219163 [Mya arenaria]|uniref:uncharacterized protein LOC128219163 n=1 Tax=Mya arenaria TaxID=6604 RepID=UPI0022E84D39|nr:uncharacterized protein LOC128219163 [Mya arenaria]